MLVLAIGVVLGSNVSGWLSDRLQHRKVFIAVASVLFGIGMGVIAVSSALTGFIAGIAVAGLGQGVLLAPEVFDHMKVSRSRPLHRPGGHAAGGLGPGGVPAASLPVIRAHTAQPRERIGSGLGVTVRLPRDRKCACRPVVRHPSTPDRTNGRPPHRLPVAHSGTGLGGLRSGGDTADGRPVSSSCWTGMLHEAQRAVSPAIAPQGGFAQLPTTKLVGVSEVAIALHGLVAVVLGHQEGRQPARTDLAATSMVT